VLFLSPKPYPHKCAEAGAQTRDLPVTDGRLYRCTRPILEKTMKILVEGLVDIFDNVFHENKTKDIRLLDANGFCQLMLEVIV